MSTRLNEIKLEGNELQSYLETFNKDLEGNGTQTITLIQEADENDEEVEEGTYFVDQAGNYYYQATKDSEPVLTEPPDDENIQFIVEDDDNCIEDSESVAEQMTTAAVKTRKQTMLSKQSGTSEFGSMGYDAQVENNDEVRTIAMFDRVPQHSGVAQDDQRQNLLIRQRTG